MSMTSPNHAAASPAGDITSTRMFAAPREEVFRAFSDHTRLVQWWGPQGFRSTFQEFDFRVGGAWRFTMHGPDGTAYAMDKQFAEIIQPERVVLRHFQQGHDFTMTMTWAAQGDHTELTWRLRFEDPAECERVRPFILPANEQNFNRLAAHLSAPRPAAR